MNSAPAPQLRLIEGGRDRQVPPSPAALAFARALARNHVAAMLEGRVLDSDQTGSLVK